MVAEKQNLGLAAGESPHGGQHSLHLDPVDRDAFRGWFRGGNRLEMAPAYSSPAQPGPCAVEHGRAQIGRMLARRRTALDTEQSGKRVLDDLLALAHVVEECGSEAHQGRVVLVEQLLDGLVGYGSGHGRHGAAVSSSAPTDALTSTCVDTVTRFSRFEPPDLGTMRIVPFVLALVLTAAGCAQDSAAGSPQALVAADEQVGAAPTTTTARVEATTSSVSPITSEAAPVTTTLPPVTTVSSTTTVTSSVPSVTPPTTTAPSPPSTAPPSTTVTTAVSTAPFASSVATVTASDLGGSWRAGCPVAVEDLRAVTIRHHTPDGGSADGVLVVHRDHADRLVGVFAAIYESGFPITSMRPVSEYGADDDLSMAADNTSAFNCREIAGRPGVWSEHSYGRAVDVNPLVNPWVRGATVDPPAGAAYTDRSVAVPGLIRPGDPVTLAFAAIGWGWGGDWGSTKDYQHFSSTGR